MLSISEDKIKMFYYECNSSFNRISYFTIANSFNYVAIKLFKIMKPLINKTPCK